MNIDSWRNGARRFTIKIIVLNVVKCWNTIIYKLYAFITCVKIEEIYVLKCVKLRSLFSCFSPKKWGKSTWTQYWLFFIYWISSHDFFKWYNLLQLWDSNTKRLKKNKETWFNADPLSSVLRFHVTEFLFVIFFWLQSYLIPTSLGFWRILD